MADDNHGHRRKPKPLDVWNWGDMPMSPEVQRLVEKLASPYWSARRKAIRGLRALGTEALPAIPALLWAMDERYMSVLDEAHEAVEDLVPAAGPAAGLIAEGIKHPDARARELCCWMLGRMESNAEAAVPALIEALSDPEWRVRWAAAGAFRWMGPPAREAAPKLMEALNDECDWVRSDAAESIGQMGSFAPEGAVAALMKALDDVSSMVRGSAADAIGIIGLPTGAAAVHKLTAMVGEADLSTRWASVSALAELAPCVPNGVEVFRRVLRDVHDGMCASALRGLGNLGAGGASAIPEILNAMRDDRPMVRKYAAEALGAIGTASDPVIDELLYALDDECDSVREAACGALNALGFSPSAQGRPALVDEQERT